MGANEILETLSTIGTFEDTINIVAVKDMPIKRVCYISASSIKAWRVVMSEFNDVITALNGSDKEEDKIYRAAFSKALEIVMRANKYRREVVR